jgi:hypothetical protein
LRLQECVCVRGNPFLFDQVNDFRQADGGDGNLVSSRRSLIDEIARRNGQSRIIVEVPERGVSIRDAGDHL